MIVMVVYFGKIFEFKINNENPFAKIRFQSFTPEFLVGDSPTNKNIVEGKITGDSADLNEDKITIKDDTIFDRFFDFVYGAAPADLVPLNELWERTLRSLYE